MLRPRVFPSAWAAIIKVSLLPSSIPCCLYSYRVTELEAANIDLQNQLDIADRKSQVQEAAVKRLNQERESAISQLGVAYLETRELKAENEVLRQENSDLKTQLSRFSGKKVQEQDTLESDASFSASEAEDSQMYTERSGNMSHSTRDLTSKSTRSNPKSKRHEDSRAKISTQVDKEISRLEKERADEALFSLEVPTSKRGSASKAAKYEIPRHSEPKNSKKQPNTSKQRVKRVVVEDLSEPLDATQQTKASSEVEDLTLLSVIDVSLAVLFLSTDCTNPCSSGERNCPLAKDVGGGETRPQAAPIRCPEGSNYDRDCEHDASEHSQGSHATKVLAAREQAYNSSTCLSYRRPNHKIDRLYKCR